MSSAYSSFPSTGARGPAHSVLASEETLNTLPAHLLLSARRRKMKGRWEILKEGGRLSAGFNWTTISCLPSLPPILFSLFGCWHPDYHKRRRLPCRRWFTGSLSQSISKVKINSKGFKLPHLHPLATSLPPPLESYPHSVVSISLPLFFLLYFNLTEK